jgi:hypothetical protein
MLLLTCSCCLIELCMWFNFQPLCLKTSYNLVTLREAKIEDW